MATDAPVTARWLVQAEQTVTITFEVDASDPGDRDALVAGYLALRRTSESTGIDDIMDAFFGQAKPASVTIVKTEPGPWRITSADAWEGDRA